MKRKLLTVLATIALTTNVVNAQDTIVKWTFPTGTSADSIADEGIYADSNSLISTGGGTSAIDFSKNGHPTKSAQATGWNNGANTKYWYVDFMTTGYENLKLYSEVTSGGGNPGPRDFKAQYYLADSSAWYDIPNGDFITANDWTTGVLTALDIPAACSNLTTVSIRWIMTSDTSTTDSTLVASNGISKIDNIYITGSIITGLKNIAVDNNISIYPNPTNSVLYIETTENVTEIAVYNVFGQLVFNEISPAYFTKVDVSMLDKGLYIVQLREDKNLISKKVIVE